MAELTHVAEEVVIYRPLGTVDDFFTGFINNLKLRRRRASTVWNHQHLYKHYIRPVIGNVRLEDLVLSMGDAVAALGYESSETNGFRSVITLRQILKYITREGYKLPFDWREIEIPRYITKKPVEAYEKKHITQIRKILNKEHIKDTPFTSELAKRQHAFAMVRMRALFELNLHSGLRISECSPINKSDLDWDKKEIKIFNSKTGEPQIVYFNGAEKAVKEFLNLRTDTNEALFVTFDGKRVTKGAFKSQFRNLKKRTNLPKNFASHILRKTFGTHLVRTERVDIKTAQRIMRHSSIRVTANYYVAYKDLICARVHKKTMSTL